MIRSGKASVRCGLLATLWVAGALPGLGQPADLLRLQAFCQGARGNCAAVALIKAAIDPYGLGQVFDTTRGGRWCIPGGAMAKC